MHLQAIYLIWPNNAQSMVLQSAFKGCIVSTMLFVILPHIEHDPLASLPWRDLIKGRAPFFIILAICSFHQVILARSNPKEDSKYDKIASFQE